MIVKNLGDVFIASGVETVDDNTFTALFHGYEIRGKVIVPSIPTIEFFFFGNVDLDEADAFNEFMGSFEEKYGTARFRFTDKFVSVLLDIGSLDAPALKERLGAVSAFMMSNGFGAIGLQPELAPEPEPEPTPQPQPMAQPFQQQGMTPMMQQQRPQPVQQPVQQPIIQEPTVPFEDHMVLEKLTQMFILGINQVSQNTFTTLYHGYNVVGKMLSATKSDIEVIFYGDISRDVTQEFEAFKASMNEKYGQMPMRMVGGSCDVILYLDGKDIGMCKQILGEITGFMMTNNIIAINLPSSVGTVVNTYTEEYFKNPRPAQSSGYASGAGMSNSNMNRGYAQVQSNSTQPQQPQQNNMFGKFLKKFSRKP